MLRRSVAVAVTVPALVVAGLLPATPASAATSPRKAIANSKPSWLVHGHKVGSAAASAAVSGRVYLTPRGGLAAVQQYAVAVSTSLLASATSAR